VRPEHLPDDALLLGRHGAGGRRAPARYQVGVGSSSKLADGAAAAVLASGSVVARLGLAPLARLVGWGDAAVEPVDWPVAPALGVRQLLDRHGLTPADISQWEINEAFAVVVLANCRLGLLGFLPPRLLAGCSISTQAGSTSTAGPSAWATPSGAPRACAVAAPRPPQDVRGQDTQPPGARPGAWPARGAEAQH
jgi:hypothetical protein